MAYEKSSLVQVLGDTPRMRVLDYFVSNHTFDCSVQDIADYTELARNTITGLVKELLKSGLVKKTRSIGRAVMYQLDSSNEEVKLLLDFDLKLVKSKMAEAEEEFKQKQKVKAR